MRGGRQEELERASVGPSILGESSWCKSDQQFRRIRRRCGGKNVPSHVFFLTGVLHVMSFLL